ncbi:MAG: hypothetical protein ACUVWX_02060 [Kiritimatiellia bacterium]
MRSGRFILAMVLGALGIARGASIINPHLITDRSVDTSSPEAMVASLIKPGMNDRDKALAIYNFVRRTIFHYRYLTKVAGGGTMDLINGVGYCLCTPTAGTQARLCTLAGLRGEVLSLPGHGSVEVFWDGKWHWMDGFMGGCVWNKDRTDLASFEEIHADPSLLTRDNPSPVPLFPCRDTLYADALRFEPDNKEYHQQCAPDDFAWVARAITGERKPMVWDDKSSLAITLQPDETYVRCWDHEPGMYFLMKTPERFGPPHHFCGIEAEQRDVVNWPYWEPYVKEITSFDPKLARKVKVRTGRYWANGRVIWKPVLEGEILHQFATVENTRLEDGTLVPADTLRPMRLERTVRCPFMLQGGWLRLMAIGNVSASLATPVNKTWIPLSFSNVVGGAEAALREALMQSQGTREYTLRLEVTGQDARITALELITVFQHNMYALPQLLPGPNRIRITVANPEALKQTRFVVEYAWEENGVLRSAGGLMRESPWEFTVEVPGPHFPRMRHLIFRNEGQPR